MILHQVPVSSWGSLYPFLFAFLPRLPIIARFFFFVFLKKREKYLFYSGIWLGLPGLDIWIYEERSEKPQIPPEPLEPCSDPQVLMDTLFVGVIAR